VAAAVFTRYTFKNVNQLQPADLALPYSTAYAKYQILASTFTYAVTPHLANEFRFGFTLERDGNSNPFNGKAFVASTGLKGVSPAFFNGIPFIGFNVINNIGERLGFEERSRIFQFVDNLTRQHGSHLLKFGGDIRHLVAHTEAGGSTVSANYGNFFFNSAAPTSTGQEFADFLIGVPQISQTSDIAQDNNGVASSYAAYGQDTWQATHNLTLSFGLRYEFHPAFVASNGLAGNFDPSVPKSGRLI
jgi:outer membrane receptor protein involved in Fe transport